MNKLFILLLVCGNCWANDWSANLHLGSYHFSRDEITHNETNLGIGAEYNLDETYIPFGVFKNSYNDISVYAGIGRKTQINHWLRFGLEGGFITGYNGEPIPIDDVKEDQRQFYTEDKFKRPDTPVYAAFVADIGTSIKVMILSTGSLGFSYRF